MKSPLHWTLTASLLLATGWTASLLTASRSPDSPQDPPPTPSAGSQPVLTGTQSEKPVEAPSSVAEPASAGKSLDSILHSLNDLSRQHELFEWVNAMSPAELSGALASTAAMSFSDQSELLPILLTKWAKSDPQAALQYARSLKHASLSLLACKATLVAWANANPEQAIAWVEKNVTGDEKQRSLLQIVEGVRSKDPAAAFRILSNCPKDLGSEWALFRVFREWAIQNPTKAAAQALTLRPAAIRDSAIEATIRAWAETSPQNALAWAASLPEAGMRKTATANALRSWALENPAEVEAYLKAMPEGTARTETFTAAFEALTISDPHAALGLLQKLPEANRPADALQNLTMALASRDPKAAAEIAVTQPPGPERDYSLKLVASFLVREGDLQPAIEWVQKNPHSDLVKEVEKNITVEMAETDPRQALEYWKHSAAHGAENAREETDVQLSIAYCWARKNPEEALSWARDLPQGEAKSETLATVIEVLGGFNPQKAAESLEGLPAQNQPKAAEQLATVWAGKDIAGVCQWATQLAEGGPRRSAFEGMVQGWAQRDLVAVGGWLNTLPASPSRDAAVSAFSKKVAGADPQGAINWATSISDAAARTAGLEEIARSWMGTDQAAAQKWLQSNTLLPAATREKLLKGAE